MRKNIINFGVIIRVCISLLPILFGMPTIATVFCAYNLAMSFIAFGPVTALISALSAVCISMLFGSAYGPMTELSGLVWGIQAILCAAGCVYSIPHDKRFFQGMCISTMGVLVPQFLHLQYVANKAGLTVAEAIVPDINDVKAIMSSTFSQLSGGIDEEAQAIIDSGMIDEIVGIVHDTTTLLIPSVIIIVSMITAYAAMWLVSSQIRKMPFGFVHSFSQLKVSMTTSVIALIMIPVSIVSVKAGADILTTAALNMLAVLLSMCCFAGVSLADFYGRRFIKPTFVRVVLHIIILFNVFPLYIIAAIIDSFVNFRKLPVTYEKAGDKNEAEE